MGVACPKEKEETQRDEEEEQDGKNHFNEISKKKKEIIFNLGALYL